ncbi:MAG TPA: hypothetical protein VKW06_00460 [Candidatus Angelobacter sp.]|nr:hypothetical protein [Candidatus Angelobacter sp.]
MSKLLKLPKLPTWKQKRFKFPARDSKFSDRDILWLAGVIIVLGFAFISGIIFGFALAWRLQ